MVRKLAGTVVWESSKDTVDSDTLDIVGKLPRFVVRKVSEETVDPD